MVSIINTLRLDRATRQLRKKNAFIPRGGGWEGRGCLYTYIYPPTFFPKIQKSPKKLETGSFVKMAWKRGSFFNMLELWNIFQTKCYCPTGGRLLVGELELGINGCSCV